VAVAEVVVDPEGIPTTVTVLEAPDSTIEDDLERTLRTWRFPSWSAAYGSRRYLRSRVVYYYELGASGPVVSLASESGR
jgi:hypothetical protein